MHFNSRGAFIVLKSSNLNKQKLKSKLSDLKLTKTKSTKLIFGISQNIFTKPILTKFQTCKIEAYFFCYKENAKSSKEVSQLIDNRFLETIN